LDVPDLPPPLVHPPRGDIPVLLSVPHSGREYPEWLLAMAGGRREALEALEDPLVDRLVWRALRLGCGAVIARTPRAAIDCNRAEDDLDPAVIVGAGPGRVSARARGGLGIVPARTSQHGYLWSRPISRGQLEQRLDQAHRPYHGALDEQLAGLVQRFGGAILLDCHSMPAPPPGVPPVVIGDGHGRSAARWVGHEATAIARAEGFEACLNDPFAGGHVIERHGRPDRGVHALQIEIDRRCYLADGKFEPGVDFDRIAAMFERLAVELGRSLIERQTPIAAE
jgi:N-formylglutamate amidohydrolase